MAVEQFRGVRLRRGGDGSPTREIERVLVGEAFDGLVVAQQLLPEFGDLRGIAGELARLHASLNALCGSRSDRAAPLPVRTFASAPRPLCW